MVQNVESLTRPSMKPIFPIDLDENNDRGYEINLDNGYISDMMYSYVDDVYHNIVNQVL